MAQLQKLILRRFLYLTLCSYLISDGLAELEIVPKIADYAEKITPIKSLPLQHIKFPDNECRESGVSRVTISLGETNGFYYTVDGFTYSPEKIAVSGEYFNDEYLGRGYVKIFLGVESGISYYDVRPKGKHTFISIDNFNYQRFYFEIMAPYPVTIRNLFITQYNATAVIVNGPSRNSPYFKGAAE